MATSGVVSRSVDRLNQAISDRKMVYGRLQEQLDAAAFEATALAQLKQDEVDLLKNAGLVEYDPVALQAEADQTLAEIQAIQDFIGALKAAG